MRIQLLAKCWLSIKYFPRKIIDNGQDFFSNF